MKLDRTQIFMMTATVAVVVALLAGLGVIGSPGQARLQRLDDERISDLQMISSNIDSYRKAHAGLPDKLDQLVRPGTGEIYGPRMTDPETKAPYEYNRLSVDTYELCAQFQTTRSKDVNAGSYNAFWNHGPVRTCFRIDVPPPVTKGE